MTSNNERKATRRPVTRGVHHVGLTVSDLEGARAFFEGVLGFSVVAERLDYPAVFVSDGVTLITLWRVEDPEACAPFDRRRNVGLARADLAQQVRRSCPSSPAASRTIRARSSSSRRSRWAPRG